MTTRAEDISDEVDEKIDDAAKKANEVAFDRKQTIAAILNAAIEAGVVSPPCYAVRDQTGRLRTFKRVYTTMANLDDHYPERCGCYTIEHWKGQTE